MNIASIITSTIIRALIIIEVFFVCVVTIVYLLIILEILIFLLQVGWLIFRFVSKLELIFYIVTVWYYMNFYLLIFLVHIIAKLTFSWIDYIVLVFRVHLQVDINFLFWKVWFSTPILVFVLVIFIRLLKVFETIKSWNTTIRLLIRRNVYWFRFRWSLFLLRKQFCFTFA